MEASKALELVTPGRIAALILVLGGTLALALWLLRGLSSEGPARGRELSFRLEDLGGFAFWRLAAVSVFGLFLELLLIRWISSEIRIFAYFKNFVLVACFLGFGLGGFLCRRPVRLATLLLPLLALTLLIQIPWPDLRFVVGRLPALIGATSEVDMWGVPNLPGSMIDWIAFGVALIAVVPLFTLLSLAFVPIGQVIGGLLERPESGIRGYSVNVLASLAGILLYTLMCLGSTPPPAWFVVAGVLAMAASTTSCTRSRRCGPPATCSRPAASSSSSSRPKPIGWMVASRRCSSTCSTTRRCASPREASTPPEATSS